MRYTPVVKYVQGSQQQTADALSRAPTSKPTKEDLILVEEFSDSVMRYMPATEENSSRK
jgi:hypothetical protein